MTCESNCWGDDHPDTASTPRQPGPQLLLERQVRRKRHPSSGHALVRRKLFGNQSSDTRQSMAELADALVSLAPQLERADRFNDARTAWEEALALRTERYGEADGRVADVRLALADLDRFTQLSADDRAGTAPGRRRPSGGSQTLRRSVTAIRSGVRTDPAGLGSPADDSWPRTPQDVAKRKPAGQLPVFQRQIQPGRTTLPARACSPAGIAGARSHRRRHQLQQPGQELLLAAPLPRGD